MSFKNLKNRISSLHKTAVEALEKYTRAEQLHQLLLTAYMEAVKKSGQGIPSNIQRSRYSLLKKLTRECLLQAEPNLGKEFLEEVDLELEIAFGKQK